MATTVKDDLQEIRQARSKDAVTIAAQDLEIQKLSEKLTEQTEILERERTLLEASRDIRDLMGARNLHIADVFDVDSKGKDQRAFGRVFYTEGKSTLIFYAFDLNDRNTAKRNASFQVWGTRGPAQSPARTVSDSSMIDDQKQNRWVLRFEDPRILAEIDSVFVTVEPPGGSAKPTGRQIPLRIPQRESESSIGFDPKEIDQMKFDNSSAWHRCALLCPMVILTALLTLFGTGSAEPLGGLQQMDSIGPFGRVFDRSLVDRPAKS